MLFSATKSDLRKDENDSLISIKEGKKMSRKIGAVKYMECSALNQEGLKEIIAESVRASIKSKKKNGAKSVCTWCCCFNCKGS